MTIESAATGHATVYSVWNITAVIGLQARQHPAAPVLILSGRVISYREMMAGIDAIAHTLLEQGVQAGQLLGVSMLQTPLHLMALLAIARIGAISAAVRAALPQDRRALVARRFNVTVIVSGRSDQGLPGIRWQ